MPIPRRAASNRRTVRARTGNSRCGAASGVAALGQTLGIAEAGRLTGERLRRLLPGIGEAAELVCHPGLDDPTLADRYPWSYHWERETEALCGPSVREALRAAGVKLTTFRALATESAPPL